MLISNFNLYKSEWLELVFEKRNKEYGAYAIRQHYADNVVKAMIITFLSCTAAFIIIGIAIRVKPITERMIEVNNDQLFIPPAAKVEPPKPKPELIKAAAPKLEAPILTTKFIPPVVVPDPLSEEPPKIDEIKGAVGPVEIKNGAAGNNASAETGDKTCSWAGEGTGAADGNVYKFAEVMPEPYGGVAGWAKFLQKNLRYPGEALDKQMSGRVLVSFVVEKDGHLSSITVDRGAGFGMDEEAARVLKISHAWTPGMQNGKPVRVKYTLPVNFSLGD
jgi:protein TonB